MPVWRLLGELPPAKTREEIRAQYLGTWNPWQTPWNYGAEGIVVLDEFGDPTQTQHVPIRWVEHNGKVLEFAEYSLPTGAHRFYVPAIASEEGAFEVKQPRYEGFWRDSSDPDEKNPYAASDPSLLWPEPDPEWAHREAFLRNLDRAEADAQVISYRGFSFCRLCKCQNGSRSFFLDVWEWPEGFRHYIAEHRVRPSAEFQEFVNQWAQRSLIEGKRDAS